MIRPFQPEDYPALATLRNRIYPRDLWSAEELEINDKAEQYLFGRFVSVMDGQLVGVADYVQPAGMYHPQKFLLHLYVAPEFEGRGIGSALFETLDKQLSTYDPISYRVRVDADKPRAVAFAEARGFRETKRDWESALKVADYDPAAFTDPRETLAALGLDLVTLAELGDSLEVQRAYHELLSDVRLDVPRSEPATPLSFEDFQTHVIKAPDAFPAGVFFARDGERLVGLSQLYKGSVGNDLYTGLTGVRRDYRGKGVATALKIAALNLAKAIKADHIHTDNDARNVEMLKVNDKLGFKKVTTMLSMVRLIQEDVQIKETEV